MRLSIPDLQPNRGYAIQVRAVTPEGYSEWSNRYTLTTKKDIVLPETPGAPSFIVSGDAFFASWNSVTMNVDAEVIPILSYEVELTASAVVKIISVPQTTGTTPSYTLDFESNRALFGTPKPAVSMRVRAVDNQDLKSAWTSSILATNPAPGAPTAVTAVARDSEIAISWTPPSDTDLIGYNVYNGGTKLTFTPATTWAFPTTTYSSTTLTVKAVDKFGQESAAANSNAVTPTSPFGGGDTTPPAIPTALSATITNNALDTGGTANVTWTMTSPPSDLEGFVVQYRKVGTTPWAQVTTDKEARAVVVNLQDAYSNYEFQIKARDWSANESAFSTTHTATAPTNTAPSTPAAPTVFSNTQQIQVRHAGTKAAGGSMESDVSYYEVYSSSTASFTADSTTMLGTIQSGPVIIDTFNIPASASSGTSQTWYVKVIAVDRGGLKSAASAEASSSVGLIGTLNIADAAINNAKINDLAANKITAGSGLINDIVVKSKLTLGDASTIGAIESFGYSAGSAGFRFDKTLLEINQGSIAAAALKIQNSQNIISAAYSDFEGSASFYTNLQKTASTATAVTTQAYNNKQSLQVTTSNATNSLYMAKSTTDWNMQVGPSKTYIVSWYAFNPTGAVASTVTPSIQALTTVATVNGSTYSGTATAMPVNNAWTRYSTTITTASTVTGKALLFFNNFTNATNIFLDSIQVEEKIGSLDTPSTWKPPGGTTIDGSLIRTGSIQSTQIANVVRATPVYDSTGLNILYYSNPVTTPDPTNRTAWIINSEGSAEFSNLSIRGNVIVGNPDGTTNGQTTINVSFTANTQNTTVTLSGAPANSFIPSDVGRSISGAGIPAGATIVLVVDGSNANISAPTTATATGVTVTVVRPARINSALSSANYTPGISGWTIRSDGYAEFQSIGVGTFPGDAIKPGTISSKEISATYAYLGSVRADQVIAGNLKADYALLGSITLGTNFTLSAISGTPGDENYNPGGLSITIDDSGGIFFPADGSDANITAVLNARKLIVDDDMTINGQNNQLFGAFKINSFLPSPSAAPLVSAQAFSTGNGNIVPLPTGVARADHTITNLIRYSAGWVVTYETYINEVDQSSIWIVPDATGVAEKKLEFTDPRFLGIAVVGTSLYVMIKDPARVYGPYLMPRTFIREYSMSTWTQIREVEWTADRTNNGTFYPYLSGAANDGLIVARGVETGTYANKMVYRHLNVSTLTSATAYYSATNQFSSQTGDIKHFLAGNFDYGSHRNLSHIPHFDDNYAETTPYLRVYDGTGERVTTEEFQNVAPWTMGSMDGGIQVWDGTNLYLLKGILNTPATQMYKLSNNKVKTTRSVKYTWYDSVNPSHETLVSPAKSYSHGARTYMLVSTPSAIPVGAGDDSANSIGVYIEGYRQGYLSPWVTSAAYGIPDTGVNNEPTSNTFADVSTPGSIISTTTDGFGNPYIQLKGDGSWRLGHLAGNADGTDAMGAAGGFRSTTTDQSITNWAIVNLTGAQTHLTGGMTFANNVVTVPRAGLYQISVIITFAAAAAERRIAQIARWASGAAVPGAGSSGIGRHEMTLSTFSTRAFSTTTYCQAGDSLRLDAFSTNTVLIDNGHVTQLNVTRVG